MNPNDPINPAQDTSGPIHTSQSESAEDLGAAANLIRQKLGRIYGDEPEAAAEQQQAEAVQFRSKHQAFMHQLTQSGRSMEEIQTAWHQYYANLPDNEKHEVWQEFYATNSSTSLMQPNGPAAPAQAATTANTNIVSHKQVIVSSAPTTELTPERHHTFAQKPFRHLPEQSFSSTIQEPEEIKANLLETVKSRAKPKKKGSLLHSMAFGLGMGLLVMVILLFGLFNERFIAPFMTPSRNVSSTALIIDPESATVGSQPKLIIPKINVEIPVVYDEPSIAEDAVQAALERGVVHYATTPNPGELGNGAIFGHSANNILNKGQYKFAFVLLHKLETGDTFYLEKDGKRYVYKVYEKKVVPPTEVSVLRNQGKPATFALITCDPPGTSQKRLIVYGEQISPDPLSNTASTSSAESAEELPSTLPSDPPSVWGRITSWFGQ